MEREIWVQKELLANLLGRALEKVKLIHKKLVYRLDGIKKGTDKLKTIKGLELLAHPEDHLDDAIHYIKDITPVFQEISNKR